MKEGKLVVAPGMNTVKCNVCKDGTVFIPVTMELMARMRCGEIIPFAGMCHAVGHRNNFTITAWPPAFVKEHYGRT